MVHKYPWRETKEGGSLIQEGKEYNDHLPKESESITIPSGNASLLAVTSDGWTGSHLTEDC